MKINDEMRKKSILFLMFLSCLTAGAQTVIKGTVLNSSAEPVVGAIIIVEGTSYGAASNAFGEYNIDVKNGGNYTIEVKAISYATQKISGIEVASGKEIKADIVLQSESFMVGGGVEIKDFRKTSTEAAVIMEMREAKGVVSGVGAVQIQKGQDRNASEVARRIPGVTIIDNRFVMVRGLTERYNAVMMNGVLVPSLEPDVRSFSFDLIPSQAIDRFLIFKSPSPDLPGEFAGGAINVYTKNFPDYKTSLDVSMATNYRSNTTGQEFLSNVNSSSEALGFDNGTRDLPSDFPSNVRNATTEEERRALSLALPNSWGYESGTALPDRRVKVSFGKRFQTEKVQFGNFTAISYSRTALRQNSRRLDYNVYDEATQVSDTVFSFDDMIYQKNANVGVLHNWGMKTDKSFIEFKNFLNQNGLQSNTFRTGRALEEGNYRQEYSFRYTERRMYNTQLTGTHKLFKGKGSLNWALGYAQTRRNDPDWKRIRYTRPLDGSDENFHAYFTTVAQPFFSGRLFMNLKEDVRTYAANYEHKLKQLNTDKEKPRFATIKAGFYIEDKDRDFGSRNLGYVINAFDFDWNKDTTSIANILAPENMVDSTGFLLDEDTRGADKYHASSNLYAGYAMLTLPFEKLTISGGIRLEQNSQVLTSADITGTPIVATLDSLIFLPSINVSYTLSKKTTLRGAYGKTVNRPEFRELAPFSFYDFENNFINSGNPNLTFATNSNADLRIEHYPSNTEYLSAAVFYKEFNNPIEPYFVPGVGSGGTRSFAPGNALGATSYGVEFDIRKSLKEMTANRILQNMTLVANASFIKSDIQVSADGLASGLNPNRPMVGQSPYIINGGLYYDNDSLGWQITVLYNRIGPRVTIVGIPDIPEVYEMSRDMLDIAITKSFKNGFSVRAGVQDVLKQDFVFLQDANQDGKLSRANDQRLQYFNRGNYWSVTLSYKFREDVKASKGKK
ncbi:MAG: carboxypeptidase regulatory-like domain-containing protein [Flavobacteriales bacterium]|nr:carboxypeptidase regulatory-like domain-containing protein [Flavobacteriales bacterium]MDP4731484.1 carboxypeptidase regulatory-like domain-containing protein [Flavobacteriales bacterium]MDP4818558.1 carboxypeptidase regulatory-like domain-containing protein [Flavobacteriales bacterium]